MTPALFFLVCMDSGLMLRLTSKTRRTGWWEARPLHQTFAPQSGAKKLLLVGVVAASARRGSLRAPCIQGTRASRRAAIAAFTSPLILSASADEDISQGATPPPKHSSRPPPHRALSCGGRFVFFCATPRVPRKPAQRRHPSVEVFPLSFLRGIAWRWDLGYGASVSSIG